MTQILSKSDSRGLLFFKTAALRRNVSVTFKIYHFCHENSSEYNFMDFDRTEQKRITFTSFSRSENDEVDLYHWNVTQMSPTIRAPVKIPHWLALMKKMRQVSNRLCFLVIVYYEYIITQTYPMIPWSCSNRHSNKTIIILSVDRIDHRKIRRNPRNLWFKERYMIVWIRNMVNLYYGALAHNAALLPCFDNIYTKDSPSDTLVNAVICRQIYAKEI